MTRYKNCGAAIVLPTAPAWTFGGKHGRVSGETPPGPGPGAHSGTDDWNAASTRFGGAPPPGMAPWQYSSAPYTGNRYLKPDYLSKNPKGPAWTFGSRHPRGPDGGPGVGAYDPNANTFNTWRQPHASWGPPPRARPPSAPPRAQYMDRDRRKPPPNSRLPGNTFKGYPQKLPEAESPGPAAYKPCCGERCCDACDKYKGWSFGLRPPRYQPPPHPGPNDYHVGCTTLGAAAAGCTSNDLDHSYHAPTRRDHRGYR